MNGQSSGSADCHGSSYTDAPLVRASRAGFTEALIEPPRSQTEGASASRSPTPAEQTVTGRMRDRRSASREWRNDWRASDSKTTPREFSWARRMSSDRGRVEAQKTQCDTYNVGRFLFLFYLYIFFCLTGEICSLNDRYKSYSFALEIAKIYFIK